MSSTKIINVLKDDSFSEIMDLFKVTPSEEVIFVLPKRSRAFQKEDHFAALRAEAKGLGKKVSFLCSNPELNELAKKYRFDVLLARSPVPRTKSAQSGKINSINVVNQIEDFYSEPALDKDSISTAEVGGQAEEDSNFEKVAAVQGTRRLDDVLTPETEDQRHVKVSGAKEKAMPVKIHQSESAQDSFEHSALSEVGEVWNSQQAPMEIKTVARSWSSWLGRPKIRSAEPGTTKRSTHRMGLITLASGAVIVLGAVIFVTSGKAQITIKPADAPLDMRLAVFASDTVSSTDSLNMAIPGQVFNIQKTVSKDFPATGHVDVAQKARGTITAYNELSVTQPLVATTRFESVDHHIFHTLTSVVIPAAKTSNGKLIPGSVEVQVIADKPGSDYNVPVGLFTVPAFKEKGDTLKYQKVYGQSDAAMHSGTSGQATVVTDSDLASAKQALTTLLTTSIQDELKSQINGLKVVNDTEINVGQPTSTSPADSTATTFTANLSGSIKTVGFKPSDLNALVVKYIDSHNNMTVLPEKLTLAYENTHWDTAKNGLSFTVHITGPSYAKIDQQRIITDLLGKNDSEIKAYLGSVSGVANAYVSLSPFWVRSIPRSQDRVKVDLSY